MKLRNIFHKINVLDWKERLRGIDFYFSPFDKIPEIIREYPNVKACLFLHDTIPYVVPEYYKLIDSRFHWHKKLVESLSNEDLYFANSQSTKNDFLKLRNDLNPENITVALLAADSKFIQKDGCSQRVLKKYNIPKDNYALTLSAFSTHKNILRIVRTFVEFLAKNNIHDLKLVIAGIPAAWFKERAISELGEYKEKVVFTGYVDDEDLADIYSGAKWFIFTSKYEGFGLPALEAMSCGCALITSNNSSLPEIAGDAAQLINCQSDSEHIEAYEKYYYDEKFRKAKAVAGVKQAKKFSWKKCTDIMIKKIFYRPIQL